MDCQSVFNFLLASAKEHYVTVSFLAGYVFLAFVNNLPAPGTPFKIYPIFYGMLQSLCNLPQLRKFEIPAAPAPPKES